MPLEFARTRFHSLVDIVRRLSRAHFDIQPRLAVTLYGTAHDLDGIWSAQELRPALIGFVETPSVQAHEHITNPPGGQNVTEWAKKLACWEAFRDLSIEIPAGVRGELVTRDGARAAEGAHVFEEQVSAAESEQVARVAAVASQTWFDIAAWAKDTQSLQPWQRSISFTLGKQASIGKPPTRKQAVQGRTYPRGSPLSRLSRLAGCKGGRERVRLLHILGL